MLPACWLTNMGFVIEVLVKVYANFICSYIHAVMDIEQGKV